MVVVVICVIVLLLLFEKGIMLLWSSILVVHSQSKRSRGKAPRTI